MPGCALAGPGLGACRRGRGSRPSWAPRAAPGTVSAVRGAVLPCPPSRHSRRGQGPVGALIYCWVTFQPSSPVAVRAFPGEGRVGTAGAAPGPGGCRKLISSSEDTLTNAGLAGAVGSAFQGTESVVPAVPLHTGRDVPASVSAWQEVGLSYQLLQLLCPAQNMLKIREKLLV